MNKLTPSVADPSDLPGFLDLAWNQLGPAACRTAPSARRLVMASISPQGHPEARMVILRAADRVSARLDIHTDLETPKVASLRACPWVEHQLWVPETDMQLRLRCRVDILTGDTVAQHWNSVPETSRIAYGTKPVSGQPIPDVYAYEKPANPARFAVLACWVQRLDALELGAKHRRAIFNREDDWAGCWVAP